MRKIGYNFNNDQIEELYAYIDKDNDNKLYFDELESEIYNQQVDLSKVLRQIRR